LHFYFEEIIVDIIYAVLGNLGFDIIALIGLVILGLIIIFVIRLILILIPAVLLAFVVWLLTGGSLFWAGIAFLVVAALSLLKKL
jgi:membrane protein implicated in regulation of membrane protease activity